MKKLFKKPVFWVVLTVIIGLIVARIIQVKNNLKKTAATSGAKLGAGAIAKAFFTEPIYSSAETKSLAMGISTPVPAIPAGTGGIKPMRALYEDTFLPMGNMPMGTVN